MYKNILLNDCLIATIMKEQILRCAIETTTLHFHVLFGVNNPPPVGYGAFCFRLQSQVCHHAYHLHPENNEERRYGQHYTVDIHEALQAHCEAPENSHIFQPIFEIISCVMENNPYAVSKYEK